jgi:adenylate cyclase
VIFVDIIGSTQLVTSRPAVEVVELLNRFFAVVVDEVDRHHGLVNKFEGDAVLAVFGVPVALENAEGEALAAARAMAERLRAEVPECDAGIGVAAARWWRATSGPERFEYTVIGEPVNEAAGCASCRRPSSIIWSPPRKRWPTPPNPRGRVGHWARR